MAAEVKKEIELEIAHVLFLDIVGYSKLSVNEQHAQIEELSEIVRLCEQFRKAEAAGRLLKIPTGDGMALVFYKSPEEPAQCAVEISRALKDNARLHVRMGIHSGPVSGVVDVTERTNVAGAGINIARRVMDCGDAGHILLSHHVAEDLAEYERWRPFLHDIGTFEVKHGVRVHLFSVYSEDVGNSGLPRKLELQRKHRARLRWSLGATALASLIVVVAVFFSVGKRSTPPAPDKSIAVLPFENLSSDKENAYFAAGLQDEILSRLAGLGELKVISRASTEKYPSRPQNLKTIAAELGVANILEGSVQKVANEAHINVQLINALSDSHVWAQSYSRTLEHVFVVEGEIAQHVADALRVKLLPEQIKKLNVLPTQNSHAYDLLLKGEYALDRAWKSGKDEKDLDLAISYFEEAVKLDSQFALAFAQLAYAEATKYRFGYIDYSAKRVPELRTRAKAHADEALRLKPDLALAHVVLGKLQEDDNLALTEFKRALEIDPRISEAILEIGYYALSRGRVDEAIEAYSKALEFDPRNVLLLRLLAVGYMMRKDYAQSAEFESRALALDPTSEIDAANLANSIVQDKGDISAALSVLDTVPLEQQQSHSFAEVKRWLMTLRRDFPAAYEVVENVPAENWRTSWHRPMLLGEIQIALGQKQRGRQLLEEARTNVTAAIAKDSKEELSHGNLALIDSALGLSDEALREADQAIELQPMKKDAFRAPQWLENRAKVNVRLGRIEEAIEQLEQMIALPVHTISAWDLKLDPAWDPLRNDPRFQKLVAAEEAQEKH